MEFAAGQLARTASRPPSRVSSVLRMLFAGSLLAICRLLACKEQI